jgi:hypothetical protein
MLAIQNLRPGQRIRLKRDHAIAEVVDNPRDGTWLLIRRVLSPGEEEVCHVDDVDELVQ